MPEGKRRNTVTPFLGQELSERWSHCQSALLFRRTRPTTNGTYSHFANRRARQKSLYAIEAWPSIMGQLLFQPAMFTRTLIFRLDGWTARSGVDVTFVVKGLCGYTSLPLRINRFSLTLKSLAMRFNESLNSRVIFTSKHELQSFKYLTIYLEESLSNYRRLEIVLKPEIKRRNLKITPKWQKIELRFIKEIEIIAKLAEFFLSYPTPFVSRFASFDFSNNVKHFVLLFVDFQTF